MGFFVPLQCFSLIWKTSLLPMNGFRFRTMLDTHGYWAWGFFNMPHLLWHGPILYNGYLQGPVTLKPVAKRLTVELSLNVLKTKICPDCKSNPNLPYAGWTLYLYTTTVVKMSLRVNHIIAENQTVLALIPTHERCKLNKNIRWE